MRGMGAFGWALKIKGRSKSKGKGQVNYPTQATEAWMGHPRVSHIYQRRADMGHPRKR